MNESSPLSFYECHQNCEYITRNCKAMTINDVASTFGIHRNTVRRKYDEGSIPMFKVAGTIRGFKCWITVSIRNPEEIEKIQNRGTLDFSSHKTLKAY
jgi:hypothetical protein